MGNFFFGNLYIVRYCKRLRIKICFPLHKSIDEGGQRFTAQNPMEPGKWVQLMIWLLEIVGNTNRSFYFLEIVGAPHGISLPELKAIVFFKGFTPKFTCKDHRFLQIFPQTNPMITSKFHRSHTWVGNLSRKCTSQVTRFSLPRPRMEPVAAASQWSTGWVGDALTRELHGRNGFRAAKPFWVPILCSVRLGPLGQRCLCLWHAVW